MPTDDRQQALDQEHPLDAAQPEQPVELQQTARKRITENAGERDAHIEVTAGPAQVPRGDPIGEEEDDAGEEAGFHDTEQEAQDVEAGRPLDEHEGGGDDAPGHHDPGQPPLRPDPVQQRDCSGLRRSRSRQRRSPAPKAYEAALMPKSASNSCCANETLLRSRNAITYISSRNGISRLKTFRFAMLAQLEATLGV